MSSMTKAAADAIADEKQREKLFEVRQGLMELQARVLDDQMTRIGLVSELDKVKQELAAERTKKAALDDYELVELAKEQHGLPLKDRKANSLRVSELQERSGVVGVLQVESGYGIDQNETRYWCTASREIRSVRLMRVPCNVRLRFCARFLRQKQPYL